MLGVSAEPQRAITDRFMPPSLPLVTDQSRADRALLRQIELRTLFIKAHRSNLSAQLRCWALR